MKRFLLFISLFFLNSFPKESYCSFIQETQIFSPFFMGELAFSSFMDDPGSFVKSFLKSPISSKNSDFKKSLPLIILLAVFLSQYFLKRRFVKLDHLTIFRCFDLAVSTFLSINTLSYSYDKILNDEAGFSFMGSLILALVFLSQWISYRILKFVYIVIFDDYSKQYEKEKKYGFSDRILTFFGRASEEEDDAEKDYLYYSSYIFSTIILSIHYISVKIYENYVMVPEEVHNYENVGVGEDTQVYGEFSVNDDANDDERKYAPRPRHIYSDEPPSPQSSTYGSSDERLLDETGINPPYDPDQGGAVQSVLDETSFVIPSVQELENSFIKLGRSLSSMNYKLEHFRGILDMIKSAGNDVNMERFLKRLRNNEYHYKEAEKVIKFYEDAKIRLLNYVEGELVKFPIEKIEDSIKRLNLQIKQEGIAVRNDYIGSKSRRIMKKLSSRKKEKIAYLRNILEEIGAIRRNIVRKSEEFDSIISMAKEKAELRKKQIDSNSNQNQRIPSSIYTGTGAQNIERAPRPRHIYSDEPLSDNEGDINSRLIGILDERKIELRNSQIELNKAVGNQEVG